MSKMLSPWGRQCKVQMAALGISQKELSKSVGLTYTYVSAIINGRIIAPKETVEKISKALQINESYVK